MSVSRLRDTAFPGRIVIKHVYTEHPTSQRSVAAARTAADSSPKTPTLVVLAAPVDLVTGMHAK